MTKLLPSGVIGIGIRVHVLVDIIGSGEISWVATNIDMFGILIDPDPVDAHPAGDGSRLSECKLIKRQSYFGNVKCYEQAIMSGDCRPEGKQTYSQIDISKVFRHSKVHEEVLGK